MEYRKYIEHGKPIKVKAAKLVCLTKLFCFICIGVSLVNCVSNQNDNYKVSVITEMTTSNTTLNKSDVARYFCNNLTEYFNSYKYYKITS
jgi:hypothetical protein